MHFYESSIITTKDGLLCQVYGNEHPPNSLIVKPKYIPTDKIESSSLQYRFMFGKKMNRLNLWGDAEKLKNYIQDFKKQYILSSKFYDKNRLIFSVPIDNIERIFFPRRGLSQLMEMPPHSLDQHLATVQKLVHMLLGSGLRMKDLGVTYSTLMGHYSPKISDINIVVYGKQNFWQLMAYLQTARNPLLSWKTKADWKEFYLKRNRFNIFDEKDFVNRMCAKKSEGFFDGCLFVIFGTEKEDETWFNWGKETYRELGVTKVIAEVTSNFSSVTRPGIYDVKNATVESNNSIVSNSTVKRDVRQIVFYCRDYCMLANPGETIEASGVLEEVTRTDGAKFYRVVVGYFDAFTSDRRDKEYIRVVQNAR
jgi:predicted nucleotidyltransferase